jgi:hypothetical protein
MSYKVLITRQYDDRSASWEFDHKGDLLSWLLTFSNGYDQASYVEIYYNNRLVKKMTVWPNEYVK